MRTSPFIPLAAAALVLCGFIISSLPAADPYPGYALFSMGKTACLYNMDKEKVYEWEVAEGSIQTSPCLLPDGSMLCPLNKGDFTFKPGGAHSSGTFQRIDWGGGEVVWECSVTEKLGGRVNGYINSISYNKATDQVFANIQTPGTTLAVIDHSTPEADLVFKWDEGFSGRLHGGSWVTDHYVGTNIRIPDSNATKMRVGNIVTVSNGDNEVAEIDPRTKKRVKNLAHEFSKHQGSVQRLPNGNTLIVSGYSTRID